jgi:hypothetical protein
MITITNKCQLSILLTLIFSLGLIYCKPRCMFKENGAPLLPGVSSRITTPFNFLFAIVSFSMIVYHGILINYSS